MYIYIVNGRSEKKEVVDFARSLEAAGDKNRNMFRHSGHIYKKYRDSQWTMCCRT